MDKLIQPIRRFCHLHGVDFSCFVDDSINISLTKIKALACLKFIKYVFTCAGWELSLAKTKGPATMILYLGFHINSIDMKITVPYLKVIILANDISKLIDKFHVAGQIHSKELAHVLGMACHFITSHGNIMRICTRTCQQQLGLTVQLHDWNSHLKLTDKMTWELSHLKDFIVRYCFFTFSHVAKTNLFNLYQNHIPSTFNGFFIFSRFNGQAIRQMHTTVRVLLPAEQEVYLGLVSPSDVARLASIMVSDSSETKAYIYEADQLRIIQDYPFKLDEQQQSSTYRELLAVHQVFLHNNKFLELNKGQSVAWLTDNQAVVSILQRGSRITQIQQLAMDITISQVQNDIKILPVWQRRNTSLLQLADDGSKSDNTDEWSIADHHYNAICKNFNVYPSCDLMATSKNSKCNMFYSKLPDKAATGVNVFLQELSSNISYYACPPIKLITPLVHKILDQSNITCLLVIPYWPSASFWPLFIDLGRFRPFIKKLFIFQTSFTSESDKCIFKDQTNFSMMALLIKS